MAEERVMPQSLVLQTDREGVISKVTNMKLNNLTAKQQACLVKYQDRFKKCFLKLVYDFIGLSESQLKQFRTDEIKVLDELIVRKAWPWAIFQVLFSVVPFIGWIAAGIGFGDEYKSFSYLLNRRYLKKIYGENFLSKIKF